MTSGICHIEPMRRLTHLIVLVAFTFSCGGHWTLFQGIAWANMIREYSKMVPLTQAVQMTFSGQYPCHICKAIADKKSAEQQKALAIEKYDKKYFPPAVPRPSIRTASPMVYFETTRTLFFRSDAPSIPPPRFTPGLA